MEMKMPYRLARVRAAVCHHTEAVSEAKLLRQLRDHGKNVPDQRGVFLAQLRRGGNVRLRHHQKVLGRERLDIIERKAELIFIELLGGISPAIILQKMQSFISCLLILY